MNYLRLLLATGTLMLVFAIPAFAGKMETPVASPSPLPATGWMDTTSTAAVTGDMSGPGVSADPVTEIALSLMQSVLALF